MTADPFVFWFGSTTLTNHRSHHLLSYRLLQPFTLQPSSSIHQFQYFLPVVIVWGVSTAAGFILLHQTKYFFKTFFCNSCFSQPFRASNSGKKSSILFMGSVYSVISEKLFRVLPGKIGMKYRFISFMIFHMDFQFMLYSVDRNIRIECMIKKIIFRIIFKKYPFIIYKSLIRSYAR